MSLNSEDLPFHLINQDALCSVSPNTPVKSLKNSIAAVLQKNLKIINNDQENVVPTGSLKHVWAVEQQGPLCSNMLTSAKLKPLSENNLTKFNEANLKLSASFFINEQLIETLISSGHIKLASTLREDNGQIWNFVKNASSPLLMEQLSDLYKLAKTAQCPMEPLIKFCLAAVCPMPPLPFSVNKGMDDTNIILGKIMFLINIDPQKLIKVLDSSNLSKSYEAINRLVDNELDMTAKRISECEYWHQVYDVQDCKQASFTRLVLEIASILIVQTGALNIGMIKAIRDKMFPAAKEKTAAEDHILFVLKTFEESRSIRTTLSYVEAPSSPKAPANHMIRITLDLTYPKVITDVDAKKTALIGLLAHLRQGPVNSCFATFIAIEVLSTNLEKCLVDFKEMLRNGCMTRKVNGHSIEFPFLMNVSGQSHEKTIIINKDGTLAHNLNKAPIWKMPGIIAACNAIGISKIELVASETLHTLFPSDSKIGRVTISLKMFLQALIEKAIKIDLINKQEGFYALFQRAQLAVEGQTHNILQRTWENAIANTSEAKDGSMLKQSVLNAIMQPIIEKSSALPAFLENRQNPFVSELTRIVRERIQFQFNPQIVHNENTLDNHSSSGAFVLYDKQSTGNSANWKLIDSPTAFLSFILSAVRQATTVPAKSPAIAATKTFVNAPKLIQFINSQKYLELVLEVYHQENTKATQLAAYLGTLPHTPWLDKTGNDPQEVLHVYLETASKSFTKTVFTPSTPLQLFKEIVQFGKKAEEVAKALKKVNAINATSENTHAKIPLIIHGLHACSMMLGHPTIQKVLSAKDFELWMKENMTLPSAGIAQTVISTNSRSLLINFLMSKIDEAHRPQFSKQAHALTQNMAIREYRGTLLNIASKYLEPSYENFEDLAGELDAFLMTEALPENILKILRDSRVHFADSNWERGMHETHFCFLENPGTGSFELWEVLENGKGLFPLKQNRWIQGKKWICIPDPKKLEVAKV